MINLRYHVVSITAVFLALGIGLAFGAAFVDRLTIDALERNIDAVENQNQTLEERTSRLEQRVEAAEGVEQAMLEQGLPQLVQGRLEGVPVLVLATRGIDEDPVTGDGGIVDAVVDAGASFGGVLWLTDRLVLDDDNEVRDLGTVLGLSSVSPDRLRTELVIRLSELLSASGTPLAAAGEQGVPDPANPVPVPPLLQGLIDGQFLELDAPESPPAGFALLPPAGARYVVASGPGAVVPDEQVLLPLLRRASEPTSEAGRAVLVGAQSGPAADADLPEGQDAAALRVAFVGPVRGEDALRARMSTVDDLETFAGVVAAVLALEHGAADQFGHYGVGDGAQSLLPAALPIVPAAPD
jgi:hypothetical protein